MKTSTFAKIALGGVAFLLVIAIISLYIKLGSLEKKRDILSASLDEYRKSIEEMEYDLSLSKEDYIEKYAREVLGYHKNGEIIFITSEN